MNSLFSKTQARKNVLNSPPGADDALILRLIAAFGSDHDRSAEEIQRQKRESGYKHHAAVRALAFQWIRILFRLWKTNSTYDEKPQMSTELDSLDSSAGRKS